MHKNVAQLILNRTSLKKRCNVPQSKNIRWAVMVIFNYYGSNLTNFCSPPKFGVGRREKRMMQLVSDFNKYTFYCININILHMSHVLVYLSSP